MTFDGFLDQVKAKCKVSNTIYRGSNYSGCDIPMEKPLEGYFLENTHTLETVMDMYMPEISHKQFKNLIDYYNYKAVDYYGLERIKEKRFVDLKKVYEFLVQEGKFIDYP